MDLYLIKKGAKIKLSNNQLVISRTDEETKNISIEKINTITIGSGISLSSDLLLTMIEKKIDVVLDGKVTGRVWSSKFGSISDVRKAQLKFKESRAAVEWIKMMISKKLDNQITLLYTFLDSEWDFDDQVNTYIAKIEKLKLKMESLEGESIDLIEERLRGLEGNASKHYFNAISACLPDMYKFEKRSRRPAKDMFNAMLNYAYGILYSRIEHALTVAGIDPYIGIFHRDDYNKPSLVFDIIEEYRVWADWVVCDLCSKQVIFKEFFEIEKGEYYLNYDGKRLLIQCFDDYLKDYIGEGTTRKKRINILQIKMHQLASFFKTHL